MAQRFLSPVRIGKTEQMGTALYPEEGIRVIHSRHLQTSGSETVALALGAGKGREVSQLEPTAAPTEDKAAALAAPIDADGVEAVHVVVQAVVQTVNQEYSTQPDNQPAVTEVIRNTGRCTTCLRADLEIIRAKRRKGQTLRFISFEHPY